MPPYLSLGDKGFLLAAGWWQRANSPEGAKQSDLPITNESLVDLAASCHDCGRCVLKPGLVEGTDFMVFNERWWRMLTAEFGSDWEICRTVTFATATPASESTSSSSDTLALNLYPFPLQQTVMANAPPRNLQVHDGKTYLMTEAWWRDVFAGGKAPEGEGLRIPNEEILDVAARCSSCSRCVLKLGMEEGVNYRVVSGRVWRMLATEFGFDWELVPDVATSGEITASVPTPATPTSQSGPGEMTSGPGEMASSGSAAAGQQENLDQWRAGVTVGQRVDARDSDGIWFSANIVEADADTVNVQFSPRSRVRMEWLPRYSSRLLPRHSGKVHGGRKRQRRSGEDLETQ